MACASVTCSLLGLHFPLRASHAWISSTDLTLGQLSWVSAEQAQGPPLVGGGGEELGGCSCVGLQGLPQCEWGLSSNSIPETIALLPNSVWDPGHNRAAQLAALLLTWSAFAQATPTCGFGFS